MSSQSLMVKFRQLLRAFALQALVSRCVFFSLLVLVFSAASASVAYGQFTMTVSSPLYPAAVDPGNTSTATLSLQPNGSSAPVTLSCAVTTTIQQPVSLPTCDPSPLSATPPAMPSLTIGTTESTSFGLYNFTITGTSGSFTQSVIVTLTVLNVSENYTIAALSASPSPVTAGNISTAVVTVSPIGTYSGHMVTLACLSVTPVVEASPVCSFNPATVSVTSGPAPTTTLTITTFGPSPTTQLRTPRIFYALWFLVPGFGIVAVGVGRGAKRKRRLMGMLLLGTLAVGVLMMPSCGSSNNTNNPNGQTTPKNSYVFTLTGSDENGAPPGNSTIDSGEATVSLTVD